LSALETQRAILAAEFFWFGGSLGAPKVYDSGTNFSAPPTLRDGSDTAVVGASADAEIDEVRVTYASTEDGWTVTFDEA
jgi:hypothetical protein